MKNANDYSDSPQLARMESVTKRWLVETLVIPEISYYRLFDGALRQEQLNATILSVLDNFLCPSAPGIVKVIDLPAPNIEDEKSQNDGRDWIDR